jgi:hypothetical protein
MKNIYKLTLLLLLTAMAGVWGPVSGQGLPRNHPLYTLYPPLNFAGTQVECNVYLQWQKPQMPDGTTPPGLIGYNLYRGGSFIHHNPSADSLVYYDYNLECFGLNSYTLTAKYDLTPYGIPGQFGESPVAGPVNINVNCSMGMPFSEPWNTGNFSFQSWRFIPAQGNWTMNTGQGNPAPAAYFNGVPAMLNYDVTMKSTCLPYEPFVCANIFLEFDCKLTDIAASNTEKLVAGYYIDDTWYPVIELKNEGSTEWVHQKIDVSQVCGQSCRLGFKAIGSNSAQISSWAVDNIRLSPVCKGPSACDYTRTGNGVRLSWQPPPCDSLQYVSGYNVYRTNEFGVPPFAKINASLITGMEYVDNYPPYITSGQFKYIITDLQRNPVDNLILCEAPCDTLVVDYVTGMREGGYTGINISPNPASEYIRVQSGLPVESCELFNVVGEKVLTLRTENRKEFTIPVSELPAGIYMVSIKNVSGKFVSKISVAH